MLKDSEFAESHRTGLKWLMAVLLGIILLFVLQRYFLHVPFRFYERHLALLYVLLGLIGVLTPYATALVSVCGADHRPGK